MILRNVFDLRGLLGGIRESRAGTPTPIDSRTPPSIPLSDVTVPGAGGDVDLEGRWVLPSVWDHHVHFGQWTLASRWVDVSSATSAAHAAAIVREAIEAGRHEPGTVLMGSGFRDALWSDEPSADLLAFGEVPVGLISGDVHTVWSNGAALRMLGRPESDWWLREQPAYDINLQFSQVEPALLDRWALDAAATAAARGITGIVDLEMDDAPGSWARRFGTGFRGMRVRAAVYPHTPSLPEFAHDLYEVGPYKLFTDGSLNTRTAWCDHPYPDSSDVGLPSYGPGGLLAAAREGVARGLLPTIHAIGDRAVSEALDVFEALGTGGSMEHVQLIAEADIPRLAALGVRASVQPEHAMDDRDVADRYWAGRTDRAFAFRSLLDAGVELSFGSDAPVAPLDPWITMAAAVTRSRDGRDPWHPEQAITPLEALVASTHDLPGDLVVVDQDPLVPENLRHMPVHATMVAGTWTHGPHSE
jgi:predicted amidohydrolase YtcJ